MPGFPRAERARTLPLWRPRLRRRLGGGAAPAGASTVTQEGFRWRNDDGTETTATWKAAQDTDVTVAVDGSARLRVLLDAAGDPPATPYTLRYKKTTDSTWLPVPVGPTGGGSYSHVWSGADPTSAGADTTNYELGTYFSLLSAPVTLQGIRIWNPGLVNTLSAHTQNRSATLWSTTDLTGAGSAVLRTIDIPDLLPTGWSEHLFSTPYVATTGVFYCVAYFVHGSGALADYGLVAGALTSFIDNPPFRFEGNGGRYVVTSTPGSSPPSSATGAPFYGVDVLYGAGTSPNPVYIATSANIAASGEATTALLTPPGAKTTGDFSVGRMWDDENGTDSVNI